MNFDLEDPRNLSHPRERANVFSIISFLWTLDLFMKGYENDLTISDLYDTLQTHSASKLGSLLEREWRSEVEKAKKCQQKPKIQRALFKLFGTKYIFYGIVVVLSDIIYCFGLPICLQELIAYFSTAEDESKQNRNQAFLCAFGFFLCLLFYSFIWHWYIERVTQTGIQLRVAVSSLLYKKALGLESNTLDYKTDVGHLVNVLSNDSTRFDKSLMFLNHLWVSPFGTVIVTYFLWLEIGFSAFIGVAVLLFFIPLHGCLGRKISQLRLQSSVLTDRRIKLMNEIISGIMVIKMYAWENVFIQLIIKCRWDEMQKIKYISFIRQTMASFFVFHWRIAFFCSIFSFAITGNMISAQKVFITVAYFKILRDSMTSYFPLAVVQIAEIRVSLNRIQSFLMLQCHSKELSDLINRDQLKCKMGNKYKAAVTEENAELEPLSKSVDDIHEICFIGNSEHVIRARHFTAKWNETISNPCLNNISLDIKKNILVAIIGPVGAGKSSLILAILKELTPVSGHIVVSGTISYSSQEPWLFSSSIKQNILFGQSMAVERYQQVVEVCALLTDFKQMPSGDNTIIGERGVTLSVGQKARISLARSIYREADIYLFDDPLSAVDVHVSQYIFEKCFKNFLKNKTCILVTHTKQYLSDVDYIVYLEQGSVIACGSYKELQESSSNFTEFLASKENDKRELESREKNFSDFSVSNYENNLSVFKSAESLHSSEKNSNIIDNTKQTEEQIAKGTVQLNIYWTYLSSGGKLFFMLLVTFLFLLTQIFASGIDVWITYWINLENRSYRCLDNNASWNELCSTIENETFYKFPKWGVYIFSILTGFTVIITLIRTYAFVRLSVSASLNLHNTMFEGIVHTSMHFFDTNPSGRILNRFSSDLIAVDEYIPGFFMNFIQSLLPLISIVCIVAVINPYLLFPTCFILIIFFALYNFYLATSRDIKRIECIARSPVYSHFHTSLEGLISIRTFQAENILQNEFHRFVDTHSSASYLFLATSRAFGLWCDLVGILYIALVTFSFIFQQEVISEANVGLAITQSLFLTGMLQWCLRQKSELENQMISVERIKDYSDVPQESHSELCVGTNCATFPLTWPVRGEIIFENVYLRYEPEGPYILRNLNFVIRPREKIGIIGRTGAGKSSLLAALFRLVKIDGKIKIDDIDINTLDLQDVRKNISVIPQEPVLFSGTIRTNLDPFNEYPDRDLWQAFQEVQLIDVFKDPTLGLNLNVSVGGSNFSVGQKQLICLARAIIRKNKILILDEATANVDPQTDTLIQSVIRKRFENCTVLTIAHRLNTIMDSDKVLVIDSGVCVEFDQPFRLLQNENSVFSKMVSNTGSTSSVLRDIAYQKHIQIMRNELPFIDD